MSLQNCSQPSPNTIEFDLMAVSDGALSSDLRANAFQYGINFNTGILPPDATIAIDPGDGFVALVTPYPNHIRILQSKFGGNNTGITMILGHPYLVVKVRLTCSANWVNNSSPEFTLQTLTGVNGKTACAGLCFIGTNAWVTDFTDTGRGNGQRSVSVSCSPSLKSGCNTYYADADGDGYGNANISIMSCSGAPASYVADNTDCNDNKATIHPGTTFYRDADGDGFGNSNVTILACSVPSGCAANNTDCDDNNATIHRGAAEVCNGIDDNCDGLIDNPLNPVTSNITGTTARLNWKNVSNASDYEVRYRGTNAIGWTTKIINGYDEYVNIHGLKHGRTYQWQMRTDCGSKLYGSFTDLVTFTMLAAREGVVADDNDEENKTLRCYPNPATQQISFSVNGYEGEAQLQVVSVLGQQAITKPVELKGEDTYSIDISSLASGIYKVILMNGTEARTGMFVKE